MLKENYGVAQTALIRRRMVQGGLLRVGSLTQQLISANISSARASGSVKLTRSPNRNRKIIIRRPSGAMVADVSHRFTP
ncbi:hypothetical protein Q1695_002426 [Nippostrongylus brasiliensis]|nr:hypothetical protein Q1695_002426 [Nippostrongylus brasiliensis]